MARLADRGERVISNQQIEFSRSLPRGIAAPIAKPASRNPAKPCGADARVLQCTVFANTKMVANVM